MGRSEIVPVCVPVPVPETRMLIFVIEWGSGTWPPPGWKPLRRRDHSAGGAQSSSNRRGACSEPWSTVLKYLLKR